MTLTPAPVGQFLPQKHSEQPADQVAADIDQHPTGLLLLPQHDRFITKRGKCREAAENSGDEQKIDRRSHRVGFRHDLHETADQEAADEVHHHRSRRFECRYRRVNRRGGKKTRDGSDCTTDSDRNKILPGEIRHNTAQN
jgi:hypothetical protein